MPSVFNVVGNSAACATGNRLVLVPFKYGLGSTVYVIKTAKTTGTLDSVVVSSISFIRNARAQYPNPNAYLVQYNDTYYEDQLCGEAQAIALSLEYWQKQNDTLLGQIQDCGC